MSRAGFLESAALQNPAAFAVRPDLFPDYAENMGGGVARLVRYVDLPGGSWEVVYVEDGAPFVVCVTPVTSAHDSEVGPVAVAEFVTAWDALRVWEGWHPGSPVVFRVLCDTCGGGTVPGDLGTCVTCQRGLGGRDYDEHPACSVCDQNVGPGSGVEINETWAGMTGDLVCRPCAEGAEITGGAA